VREIAVSWYCRSNRRDHVDPPRLATGAAYDPAVAVEHEHGRGATDIEAANQVELRLGIDLDMRHTGDLLGDVCQHVPRRPAGLAERRRELHQRRSFTERLPEVVRAEA
jgi:hypothetical protein